MTLAEKLLAIASPSLGVPLTEIPQDIIECTGKFSVDFQSLWLAKNGFMAFESALHVFPIGSNTQGYGLEEWNTNDLWKSSYTEKLDNAFFFAEDIFGEQFAVRDDMIWRFNPETAEFGFLADSFETWLNLILDDYTVETGYPLAHEWQKGNRVLSLNERLLPKIPFILGGTYELENLYACDAVQGMLARANISNQIRNLPDGTKIKLETVD